MRNTARERLELLEYQANLHGGLDHTTLTAMTEFGANPYPAIQPRDVHSHRQPTAAPTFDVASGGPSQHPATQSREAAAAAPCHDGDQGGRDRAATDYEEGDDSTGEASSVGRPGFDDIRGSARESYGTERRARGAVVSRAASNNAPAGFATEALKTILIAACIIAMAILVLAAAVTGCFSGWQNDGYTR